MASTDDETPVASQPDASNENSIASSEQLQQRVLERTSHEVFDEWYNEREFAENIRQGTPYFNGPGKIKPPEQHSPSSLLQCHRKTTYKQLNAPAEEQDPEGIFWVGSQFEEEIALPFLRQRVTSDDEYVTNSLWVNYTVRTDAGEIEIKGETDPVIVDRDSEPLFLTEIKTKRSIEDLEKPNLHHRAQAHAYMKGLSEEYDHPVTDTLILYGSRTTLDIRSFHVSFDPVFWRQTVIRWAEQHTEYRLNDELPPAEPEYGWECSVCPYQNRCGKGDSDHADVGAEGFLPQFDQYPRQKVVEYVESHPGAKLTPALANRYPELAEEYEVYRWKCRDCGSSFEWDTVDWSVNEPTAPQCQNCLNSLVRS